MAVFKCKMCGGDLEITNETVAICQYCGTQQTLPKLDDDKRANMYDRANHLRRNNDYDKAMGIYEQILNEDGTDAEAYWSLVLCHYGIEYVEEPYSRKRIPTVNRAQFTSVFDDDNYRSALKYADFHQRAIYEKEAQNINEIQKGILAISQNEEPFDVFICYKESDNNGRRTPDSVLATELYHELTKEGFKVFFSRITLEDKLGSAYEPYIFAALNSAKVMVVLGTRQEYFKAVWVKNEWSRYLALIKQGQKKILIPAYKDMDPYDLPEEFSHLQAQDMSKLGFMQDLIRGIKKIARVEAPQPAVVKETVVTTATNIAPLLKRAFMFLEDGEWDRADEFCEQVLNIDPEEPQAYLGKLLVNLRIRKQELLKEQKKCFDRDANYEKIVRFGDEKLKAELAEYAEIIKKQNDRDAYQRALDIMTTAKTERQYKEAAVIFESIFLYGDAAEKAKECRERAEERRMAVARNAKKTKRIAIAFLVIVSVMICTIVLVTKVIIPNHKYNNALELLASGNVVEGYEALLAMDDYKDSEAVAASFYDRYKIAKLRFAQVGDYVILGNYEQDNDTHNGKEEIEWLVLEIKDGKALVVSKYALECMEYDTFRYGVTWQHSTVREWLNSKFINDAFSEGEKEIIATTVVSADKNPQYNTDPGNVTKDQVFLLSILEVNEYFNTDETRRCMTTSSAKANGANALPDGSCIWWLRTPGSDQKSAACIAYGHVDEGGYFSDHGDFAVRPAMWIDLNG